MAITLPACGGEAVDSARDTSAAAPVYAELPADTSSLWLRDGDLTSDTVILYAQGGPDRRLTFEEHGRTSLRYLPGYERFGIAYVHQAQTLVDDWYDLSRLFDLEDAEHAVDLTSEILDRAARYFKDRGKIVFVVGTSYGAFVIQHYLATREPMADRYIVLAGRLDMPPSMVDETLEGWSGEFGEDGSTYVGAIREDPTDATAADVRERVVKNLLKAAIGVPRYTADLAGMDLGKMAYFYATNDQAVGSLQAEEIEFLADHGATIVETSDGHSDVLYRFIDAVMDSSFVM